MFGILLFTKGKITALGKNAFYCLSTKLWKNILTYYPFILKGVFAKRWLLNWCRTVLSSEATAVLHSWMKACPEPRKWSIRILENNFNMFSILPFLQIKRVFHSVVIIFFLPSQLSKWLPRSMVLQLGFLTFRKRFQSLFFVTLMIQIFYTMKFLCEEGYSQCIYHLVFYFL